jgi:hypothetical protein
MVKPISIISTGDDMAARYQNNKEVKEVREQKSNYVLNQIKTVDSKHGYVLAEEIYVNDCKGNLQHVEYIKLKFLYPESLSDRWHIVPKTFTKQYKNYPREIAFRLFSLIWNTYRRKYEKLRAAGVPLGGELGLFPEEFVPTRNVYYKEDCDKGSNACYNLYEPSQPFSGEREMCSLELAKSRKEKEAWYLPFKIGRPDREAHEYALPQGYSNKEYITATRFYESDTFIPKPRCLPVPLSVDQVINRHKKIVGYKSGYHKAEEDRFWSSIPGQYRGKLSIPDSQRVAFPGNETWESPVAYCDYGNFLGKDQTTPPDVAVRNLINFVDAVSYKFKTIIIVHDKVMGNELSCISNGTTIMRWCPRKSDKRNADALILQQCIADKKKGKDITVFTSDSKLIKRVKGMAKYVHFRAKQEPAQEFKRPKKRTPQRRRGLRSSPGDRRRGLRSSPSLKNPILGQPIQVMMTKKVNTPRLNLKWSRPFGGYGPMRSICYEQAVSEP